jgi:hypothetical protein
MTSADLLALADRVEKLAGPNRELDEMIALTLNIYVRERRGNDRQYWFYKVGGDDYERRSTNRYAGRDGLPSYTESFDAAMTLVPEVYDWIVASVNGQIGGTPYACVGDEKAHFAETPVLSLVLACLRARASTDKGEA